MEFEKLNMNELMDAAGNAVTDERSTKASIFCY
jgi:hypothetical protein